VKRGAQFPPGNTRPEPIAFRLTEDDLADGAKRGIPALLSVWRCGKTTVAQARVIRGQIVEDAPFYWLVSAIEAIRVANAAPLVVYEDPLLNDSRPGVDGHAGIVGIIPGHQRLTKAQKAAKEAERAYQAALAQSCQPYVEAPRSPSSRRGTGLRYAPAIVGLVICVGVLAAAYLRFCPGPPPPPAQPKEMSVLTPEEHKRLVAEVSSAIVGELDGGTVGPRYSAFVSLPNMTKLPLFANFLSYVEDKDSAAKKYHDRRGVLVVEGEVKRAYVLVHVARPLHDWEKAYVTIDEKGGHLHGSESLSVPLDPRSTTLLYDAHDVPHDRNGVADPPSDWFSILVPGKRPVVHSFLSSVQPGLLDLSMFYECIEPGQCKVTYIPIF